MPVSMSATWDEARDFMIRERRLLIPLALATLFAGGVIVELFGPQSSLGGGSGWARAALLLGAIVSGIGQLAISALVLRPGLSVGESLRLGAGRFPRLVLVFFLFGFLLAIPFLAVIYAMMRAGYNPMNPATAQNLPPSLALIFLILALAFLWFVLRLVLVTPLFADRAAGPIEAVREGFRLTRGLFWKLLGMLLLYFVLIFIVGQAVTFVFGSLFLLLARAIGSAFTGQVLVALTGGLVTAAFALVATVFLATLYKRVSRGI